MPALSAVAIFLFLVGQFIGISSHAYFLIVGGAVFLSGLDLLVWQNFGLMPSVKFFEEWLRAERHHGTLCRGDLPCHRHSHGGEATSFLTICLSFRASGVQLESKVIHKSD